MSEALVTPCILIWARERAQLSLDFVANSLKVKIDKVKLWEKGEKKPTFNQAQRIANLLQVPFGYLFLKEPPQENLSIPDLRTFNNKPIGDLSLEFKSLLNNIILKQKWYKDYILENNGSQKYFLQQYSIKDDKNNIINNINEILHLNKYIGKSLKNRNFLNNIIKEVEKLDILVMRNGIVGSNTHKSLEINEFRGFAIYDKFAPLIFLNTKDSISAQVFTLIHEIVHLWIGESGISLVDLNYTDNDIELFCNDIAANILVPEDLIKNYWNASENFEEHYLSLARNFSVSTLVILNRLYSLKLISFDEYKYYINVENEKFLEFQKLKSKNTRGDFYKSLKSRNGTNFSMALITSTLEGKTLYKEAANLLNTKYSSINKFAKELGILL